MSAITTVADSIAIKLLSKDALLRGVGNEVHLHTVGTQQQVLPIRLKGKVHGIESGSGEVNVTKLIIYGEKEFVLLQWLPEFDFKLLQRTFLSDWIIAARFLTTSDEFVLLTAHSNLLRFLYKKEENVCEMVEKCCCLDKSTLYSALLHGNSWKELVIFGGNALGEVLMWKPTSHSTEDGKQEATLLQRVQAHNGVIFSIDYNEESSLLATTSDDRSIKFWQIDKENESGTKFTALASGFGHVARVFKGKFIQYENLLYAITVGEDSYFCVWLQTGKLVFKRRHQFGATIWNFEYDDATCTLFTVGSTGNLIAFGMRDVFRDSVSKVGTLPCASFENKAEYVTKIRFLAQVLVVGVTNENRLVYRRFKKIIPIEEWWSVTQFSGYKCTVLEVQGDLVALCGYKRCTLFKLDMESLTLSKIFDGEVLDGVIRAFQFLNAENYLVSDEAGDCLFIKGDQKFDLQFYSIKLPPCKERWLTSALLVDGEFLLASNRQGDMILYKFETTAAEYVLKDVLKRPHGYLGATVLKLMSSDANRVLVKSAGHDGSLKVICIDKHKAALKTYSREIVPVAWTEAVSCIDSCELLLGFNDNHFVAWSRQHGFTLQVSCGGGHRCWHYEIYEDETQKKWIRIIFVKTKSVLVHTRKLFNEIESTIRLPTRNTWHVKPCNALQLVERPSDQQVITISAGDDNLIKVSTYCKRSGNFTQQAEVHSHISNIRALKIVVLDADYCLIISGGGRAQLCVNKLNLNTFQVEEKLNHMLTPYGSNQQDYRTDSETRIMALDAQRSSSSSHEFHVFLGCSDGFVRRLFLRSDYEIVPEIEVFYGRCVLQVRLFADLYVIVATTQGSLHFYDLELKHECLNLRLHASGINALDVRFEQDTKALHVLSGGDDQLVTYKMLKLTSLEDLFVLSAEQLDHNHTAQVTAAGLAPDARHAYTCGVDQNLFKVNLVNKDDKRCVRSCVADIKGLCLDSSEVCYLYGCGMQIFKFDL